MSPGDREELLASVLDRMAHQLRNPLQAVTVNLEVVRMRVRQGAPEVWSDVERFARAVDANARLLHRRLQLALDMARRTPGDPLEALDLRGLLEDLCDALRMAETGSEVRVEGTDRGGAGVEARTGYLVELLVRLLDAARAGGAGGELLRVTVSRGDGTVALELPAPEGQSLPDGCVELAAHAGGDLAQRAEAGDPVWRLELPAA